jgi:hypothetical protein
VNGVLLGVPAMIADCIEPTHMPRDKDGYPRTKRYGKLQPASRVIMSILYGPEAIKGKLVCHTCNNPRCVNPNHLYIGDAQTNSDDKYKDGTMSMGESHYKWKPHINTADMVSDYELGISQSAIGDKYGISQSAVSGRIKRYKSERKRLLAEMLEEEFREATGDFAHD